MDEGCNGSKAVHAVIKLFSFPIWTPTHPQTYTLGHISSLPIFRTKAGAVSTVCFFMIYKKEKQNKTNKQQNVKQQTDT